ncbi:MAG TPA: hypothetical protein VKH81_12370 [Candidatus Angelobacter sp.]|nr:hypothetical protein [Candidatus Angelobacter sp.]
MSAKLILIGIFCLLAGASIALTPGAPGSAPQAETRQQDPAAKEMQDRMFKAANKKRQQDIREDTDKLFQLATELKTAVDKSNENMLSLDVVKKADEVEKLAKKVKDKMKEAIGPTQNNNEPPRPPPSPFPPR